MKERILKWTLPYIKFAIYYIVTALFSTVILLAIDVIFFEGKSMFIREQILPWIALSCMTVVGITILLVFYVVEVITELPKK